MNYCPDRESNPETGWGLNGTIGTARVRLNGSVVNNSAETAENVKSAIAWVQDQLLTNGLRRLVQRMSKQGCAAAIDERIGGWGGIARFER